MQEQITTVTFFKHRTLSSRLWAFTQMGVGGKSLSSVTDLAFFKLMGTGAGKGFSWMPDFSSYCLLAIWKDVSAAESFFQHHPYFQNWKSKTTEQITIYLKATKVKGEWDARQPFQIMEMSNDTSEKPIAVLTRATINKKRLLEFWRNVPQTSKAIQEAKGVLFLKGVGELPWVQQATVSVWTSKQAMREYAYGSKAHREVIQKTYARDWYSEEMFAEFQVVNIVGKWDSKAII
jgi:uncharacterized protein Usg